MSAPSIQFYPPYDVHLLRGQSFRIFKGDHPYAETLLLFNWTEPSAYINLHPAIKYRFFLSFDENKLADFGITITNFENTPGQPDYQIGLTDAEPVDPHNRIRNFYLFAVVEDPSDGSSNQTAIRIHIHNSIQEIWMSPEQLTVPKRDFSTTIMPLRARFDDDVVAQIGQLYTVNQSLDYNITPPLTIRWSPTSIANEEVGWINSDKAVGTYNIAVKVTYKGVTKQASGKVIISEDLTSNSTLRAELVTTGQSPGFAKLNQVPNVLFLSDGFTQDQAADFDNLINDYVSDLVTKKITSPFDILKGAVNYWKLFVPSRESGATYRGELFVDDINGLIGHPFPFIQDPQGIPVQNWTIEHLYFKVGLPVRAEWAHAQADLDALFAKWEATTLLTAEQIAFFKANGDLVMTWILSAERRLPEARDTAFGVSIHDYTAAFDGGGYNSVNLDRNRISWYELDYFFKTLKDKDNNLIGPVFIHHDKPIRGKDASNIVILSATRRGRAQNTFDAMFCVFGEQGFDDLTGTLADIKVSIAPVPLAAKLPNTVKSVITHELGHSFGLGDEYGEPPTFNGAQGKSVDDPTVSWWSFAKFTGWSGAADWTSNLQTRADLEDNNHQLKPYFLKWRYHRLQTVGLVAAISVNGNEVDLTVQPGQVTPFAVGDKVFIRKRKKNQTGYVLTITLGSTVLKVADILSPDPIPDSLTTYGDGTVKSIDAVTEKIQLSVTTYPDKTQQLIDLTVGQGQTAAMQYGLNVSVGTRLKIVTQSRPGPIFTLLRNQSTTPTTPDYVEKALSPELIVNQIDPATNLLRLTIPAGQTLIPYLQTLNSDEIIIVYKPIPVVGDPGMDNYPYAELISRKVLDYLMANPVPFNANAAKEEIIDSTTTTNIPAVLFDPSNVHKNEIIGLYTGGSQYHGGVYHPAAQCMMRHEMDGNKYIELCAVCRYTLINLIDPTKFAAFDKDYMSRKIYPE